MEAFMSSDVNAITKMLQFTPTMRREIYDAISPTNPKNSATGKKVLITGASRGIGKGIALSWAQAGADTIVLTGRDKSALEAVANEIGQISKNVKTLVLTADAMSVEDARQLWATVKTEVGTIDNLICNAGIGVENAAADNRVGSLDPTKWLSVLNTNAFGPQVHAYNYLQQYTSEDKEPKGNIIFISSAAALVTLPGNSAYAISKNVNARQIEYIHTEYPNVRAFSVHPGMVATDMAFEIVKHMSIDPPELTGAFSLYLSTPSAEFLRGKFLSVNWDVTEMEAREAEIKEKDLLSLTFLNAKLGPEGHPFESLAQ